MVHLVLTELLSSVLVTKNHFIKFNIKFKYCFPILSQRTWLGKDTYSLIWILNWAPTTPSLDSQKIFTFYCERCVLIFKYENVHFLTSMKVRAVPRKISYYNQLVLNHIWWFLAFFPYFQLKLGNLTSWRKVHKIGTAVVDSSETLQE